MLASPPSTWRLSVTDGNHNPSLGIPCCGESLLSCHPAGSRAADSGLGIISAHLFNKYLLSTPGQELCWGRGTDQEAQLPGLVSALGSVSPLAGTGRQVFHSSDRPSTFRTRDHKWAASPAWTAADGKGFRAGFLEAVLWKLRPGG